MGPVVRLVLVRALGFVFEWGWLVVAFPFLLAYAVMRTAVEHFILAPVSWAQSLVRPPTADLAKQPPRVLIVGAGALTMC